MTNLVLDKETQIHIVSLTDNVKVMTKEKPFLKNSSFNSQSSFIA